MTIWVFHKDSSIHLCPRPNFYVTKSFLKVGHCTLRCVPNFYEINLRSGLVFLTEPNNVKIRSKLLLIIYFSLGNYMDFQQSLGNIVKKTSTDIIPGKGFRIVIEFKVINPLFFQICCLITRVYLYTRMES